MDEKEPPLKKPPPKARIHSTSRNLLTRLIKNGQRDRRNLRDLIFSIRIIRADESIPAKLTPTPKLAQASKLIQEHIKSRRENYGLR